MNTITFRKLEVEECKRIREIDASQYINRAWREIDGNRQLVDINYNDLDFPNGFENHLKDLTETIKSGGIALGAFDNERLVGFGAVNSKIFGEQYKYVLLDQLFISNEYRGKRIGKKLFYMAAEEAKKWGAEKFYICAGSAEETVAFYISIGCEETKEINQELYQKDTRDYQLEYDFALLK
ncbi:GNAT family N-acetyltransferase [Anaeromicropila herbilytica]|uniref:N-acetyltransferase domain-containing protein n=1 Tax=Anaeromicropila herbilytica TaxID=2785025 RepID=A0A7R7EPI3_9FIRM|nr:GNAT family N-acetyltransferase [Anaeromicropila herbilytica]BCN32695.1 hypothetical protein bsdtb5_39900 [Anaeromicropila herbilytica]